MRRRKVLAMLGGSAVALPWAVRAQQASTIRKIGMAMAGSAEEYTARLAIFRDELARLGFVEGRNLALELRWAGGRYDRLPSLIDSLRAVPVEVIVATGGTPMALAAKAHAGNVPVLFVVGTDPVSFGLVVSLNRPGGRMTGYVVPAVEIDPKLLQLLDEVLPPSQGVALLVNPGNPNAEKEVAIVRNAAQPLGRPLEIVHARGAGDLADGLRKASRRGSSGLIVTSDPLFNNAIQEIARLATERHLAGIAVNREFVAAGGLMSYSDSLDSRFRLIGRYASQILRGANPAEMPVVQPSKLDLAINLRTARALGLTIPNPLLFRADEVIE